MLDVELGSASAGPAHGFSLMGLLRQWRLVKQSAARGNRDLGFCSCPSRDRGQVDLDFSTHPLPGRQGQLLSDPLGCQEAQPPLAVELCPRL